MSARSAPDALVRAPLAFDPSWIVHRDEHVVVVDKPAGLATIARDAGGAIALVPSLEAHLDRAEPLPVLSRLDRETSGLIAFPLTRPALEVMARASEAGAIAKRYVAAVSLGARARAPSGRMEDHLASHGGVTRVVAPGAGKLAIAHARPLTTRADRALIEIRLETGRTHQIRAQLAHRGAPIAGDTLYGGALAPRVLLAATALSVPHPARGVLAIEREPPAVFARWVEGALSAGEAFRTALEVARSRRAELFADARREPGEATTAFRLFSEAGDGIPGVAIDVYGDHLVVQLHDCPLSEEHLLDALASLGARGIYVKRRPKRAQDLSGRDLLELAPPEPSRGEPADDPVVVREHGVPFLVRLGDGMSSGLFLDQRENRLRVRAWARDRAVLNLFAYTCGFSVAAAAGGARSTLSIDASRHALERGRANLAFAGFGGDAHRFVVDDVFARLARLERAGERFGLVCLDPPTFSTTKRTRWTSGRAWIDLFARALRVLEPGGLLLATSNDRRMSQASFRAYARAGADAAHVALTRLVDRAPPLDFRAGPGQTPLLKGLVVERA